YWLRVPQSDGAGDLWLGPAAVTFRASRLCRMTISPNPFLSETRIAWRAPVPGAVVSIHDPSGRRVRVFEVGAAQRSGTRVWDGKDDSGHPVAAGIYFVTLQAPGAEESVRKLIRIR
ncbi:MAG: FlgD immunoglobulin-like domain containing protein, partial [Candidatus Eisenbacteria bacterium]|nr:FlgD immunoglobulin-like domain containing protein [Candidatus Eisenbacteria bacterium]